jgi:hypothetical protein
VYEAFQRSGLAQQIGENRFFRERTQAIKDAKRQLGDAIDIEPLLVYTPAETVISAEDDLAPHAEVEARLKPVRV